jgi:hypothetical protein
VEGSGFLFFRFPFRQQGRAALALINLELELFAVDGHVSALVPAYGRTTYATTSKMVNSIIAYVASHFALFLFQFISTI